ncbi:MAG TPA: baseplate J/gp47 family protein [Casimicrobiaceae bacterium]|nr:baseplate J/gp47 family protein [Casimicrobiaceae bacterium]
MVLIEAAGGILDKLLYQLNRWPQAVIQKVLNLVGVTLNPAVAATVLQTFVLSAPQQQDSIIKQGTQVSTNDGSIVFATLADLTIRAYTAKTGTLSLVAGSSAIVGVGTAFTTDLQVGYQLSVDKNTWYTVAAITDDTHLSLATIATSTVSGSAYYGGAVAGSVSAQATTTGLATSIAAGTLTTLVSSPAGVVSTTNAAAAQGGADDETVASAIARASTAFAARDVACSAGDYAYFATQILGLGGRASAQMNMNVAIAQTGYVTIAMLSPAWTMSSSVSAQERASVIRDLAGRAFSGATTVDVPANIQTFTASPSLAAACVYRKAAYDSASTQVAIAKAINNYLNPNTYPWNRNIYPGDLAGIVEALPQVDRVEVINGVVAVGMNWQSTTNSVTFTQGSPSATGTVGDFAAMAAARTFLVDAVNGAVYLVTAIVGGTITLHTPYAGSSTTFKPAWFTSQITQLATWYSLPYSSLSVDPVNPPSSIAIVGSV